MKVKFKKLLPGAILPKKATEGSEAYDLYVPEDVIIKPGRQIIQLGFAMEMEPGYQALVEPRSGFSSKGMEGYHVQEEHRVSFNPDYVNIWWPNPDPRREETPEIIHKNKSYIAIEPERFDCDVVVGKIDADYREGIGVIVNNRDKRTFIIKAGTRIAQLTFLKVETAEWEETDTLSETDRDGGFGSTGTK
jgi:dUTP pyrophosphatase